MITIKNITTHYFTNPIFKTLWNSLKVKTRGVCSVATTKKRVKILDFKLFYKHFVFVDKGNFDVKKVLKRHIDVYVFVDVVCALEK